MGAIASAWKVTDSQPCWRIPGAQRSASSIIRCTSNGTGEISRRRLTTGGPQVSVGDEVVVHHVNMRGVCGWKCAPARVAGSRNPPRESTVNGTPWGSFQIRVPYGE